MTETDAQTHAAALLDVAAVERYLTAHLPDFSGPLSAQKLPGGQSNPTFKLDSPSGAYVLRRKPPGQLLKSAHAVDREYRVMKALESTDVPVPTMRLLCDDDSVIGSMFFVMDFVEGRNLDDPRLPDQTIGERAAMFDAMNATLAALHSVDPQSVGLGDFGKAGNYYARQLSRWSQQYRASETAEIPAMNKLMAWLETNLPEDDGRVSIVHGDYRLDNLIYHPAEPSVIAVLDWELSTLGHPFNDVAYQCMQWRMPPGPEGRGLAGIDRAALGIPTEDEYVHAYCVRMGIPEIPAFDYSLAFNFFRMAAIIQGVLKRALDGNASNPERAMRMGAHVPSFAEAGLDAAGI
ncbi:MAG: phosphotransferase family protein [Pseudomonadota bacterium]